MTREARNLRRGRLPPMAVVMGSFLLGGVLGGSLAACAGAKSVFELKAYLVDYLALLEMGDYTGSAAGVCWNHGRWFFLCLLFGMTGIGALGIPVLLVARGCLLSFGIGCFLRVFGYHGLLTAFLLLGIPAVIWAPGLFLVGISGLYGSTRDCLRKSSGAADLGRRFRWHSCLVTCVIVLTLCMLFECVVLPRVMWAVCEFLG